MKKGIIWVLFAGIISLVAQEKVVRFRYDQAGNRISRITTIVIPQPARMAASPDTTKIDSTVVIDVWGERNIIFYPNPTQGDLYVRVTNGEEDDVYDYRLVDSYYTTRTQGRIVGSGITPISLGAFDSGIYYLNLFFKGDRKEFKVIKE